MNLGFHSSRSNDEYSDIGPRTAAVLTFSGNTNDSFVKELTQNSLDARQERGGDLRIKVECISVNKFDIPNFQEFENILDQMEVYWNQKSDQYKTFFKTAKKSIEGGEFKVLVFSDSLTKGLTGSDSEGTFKNCVNDENVSGKEHSDSLGNHGIGKNSVFGYSGVHTVFYSSLNVDGQHMFKGVSKLGNFNDKHGVKRSERIYYGDVDADGVKLLSDAERIPELFRREEPGLSQFVIGAEVNEDWSHKVKQAFISNYWFLFETNKLEVEIDGEILNHENYENEALLLFNEDKSRENPISYIKAYKESHIHEKKNIPNLGTVHFYVKEAEDGDSFHNRIAFLRDGMKIKLDPPGLSGLPVNISGVMFCDNPEGNSVLGAMEPHAHDKFLPELVSKKQANISVAEAKSILKAIDKFKRDVLTILRNKYTEESESIDLVDDLFSSIFGSGKGSGVGKTVRSEEETFHKKSYEVDYDGVFSSNSRNSLVNNLSEVDEGDGDGPGRGSGTGGTGTRGGTGNKKGKSGGSSRTKKKTKGKVTKQVKSRFFISGSSNNLNKYKLILRSDEDYESFSVIFSQHGDSGKKEGEMTSKLLSATSNGSSIDFSEVTNSNEQIIGYRLKGLSITSGAVSDIDLELDENSVSALKIVEVI